MKDEIIPIAYLISNIVAVIMLACSWKYPRIARLLYLFLFAWASLANSHAALKTPQYYLDYERFAFIGFYRNFIHGFFSEHITALVLIVALCQIAIAVSMLLKGWIYRTGCLGAILFLVSIAPLGVGSGFPCTLIMAAGLLLLLRKKEVDYLWKEFRINQSNEESTEVL